MKQSNKTLIKWNENIKRNSLVCFGLVWLNSSKLNFETCLRSTEPTYQSHHSSFFLFSFFFYQSLVWFGLVWFGLVWFSTDNSTVNSTNDFNGKKQTKLFFWNKNQKSLSLFVLWIDWWFFDDFSTNKKRVDLFWFFQPNQPFDTSFNQIKPTDCN